MVLDVDMELLPLESVREIAASFQYGEIAHNEQSRRVA